MYELTREQAEQQLKDFMYRRDLRFAEDFHETLAPLDKKHVEALSQALIMHGRRAFATQALVWGIKVYHLQKVVIR